MACINTNTMAMGPRISFSNDFADPVKLENTYREAPVSSDFAFSAPNYGMNSADELFFKGKILPLRENCTKVNTLRDELLSGDDDDYEGPTLGTSRWREMLGLRRSSLIKKCDKLIIRTTNHAASNTNLDTIDEMKTQNHQDNNFKGFL